jgi:hypothetical protein
VVDLVRRRLVVAVAGEVVTTELLDGLLLRHLLRQRLQSGQRPVNASTGVVIGTTLGAVRARELDGDGARRDGGRCVGWRSGRGRTAAGGAPISASPVMAAGTATTAAYWTGIFST